ncbi:antA/AntB antirepressor family protein [Escherichia marmotae]|uniref:antA/AntB antirepressor family protein n=1 Tax=Escherichia marmotae TaxID=1499973 RepID=UPI0015F3B669|nr:antA/AntB antirepressor family protein [Escherichia marmotae]MBA7739040.1 antA/AntB antirepressor family protein [Escherichia marmotae]MBA7953173.1 antA/AntB antirepressor family protein [Escherichia marmotae]
MTIQLIPVFNGTISNETALLCNARDLHAFLGVGKVFAAWITSRIAEYGFTENQDYILLSKTGKQSLGGRGGHNRKDYHLTLDTAKELAMVERNEKGRQIRRYFIECEKKLRDATPDRNKIIHGSPRTVVIRLDDTGNVIYTETVPTDAVVCTPESYKQWMEKCGWLVIRQEELRHITLDRLFAGYAQTGTCVR